MDFFGEGSVFLLAFAIVLLALVVLVLAGGRDIDTTGKRTFALYVCAVSFIALYTALIASTTVVNALTEKIKDDDSSEEFNFDDESFEVERSEEHTSELQSRENLVC